MMTFLVIVVVSAALIFGAAWGIYWGLSEKAEGFLVAVAGGSLLVSTVLELIEPATREANMLVALAVVLAGAIVFSVLDWLVKKKWGGDSGGGLLAAITIDGIPENLALGVALIGAGPMSVAALSGSILLSNLPEAAGGARQMIKNKRSKAQVFFLWTMTALLLSVAAILGNLLLEGVSRDLLAYIRCFAGGAVIGSLATEVFPLAFKEDNYVAGVAAAIGVVLAFLLNSLAG
ncbi:MAG TPA: hypothetical protein VFN25_11420 [Dokdonella sp.]|uniref:ZIP family metal transporter n=1 Tax=Dokdonella sp. TaxID=2291710 RepID=UPI002D7F3206|nr:hypothetical protein [Dokdonella sp.]HET9033503.1 hypothetical protein [Dokdonella sp.]